MLQSPPAFNPSRRRDAVRTSLAFAVRLHVRAFLYTLPHADSKTSPQSGRISLLRGSVPRPNRNRNPGFHETRKSLITNDLRLYKTVHFLNS